MTEPLVPAGVDLRGLPWMRLDTVRLLDSDLFALSTGDEFKAAVALWCKSWGQSPAGSLPQDDRVLAHLSGAGTRWKRVRAMALRGWVECTDGRLYHPVVAEQVLLAWDERQEYRAGIDAQNERKRRERAERAAMFAELKAAGHELAWNTPTGQLRDLLSDMSRDTSHTGHGDSHGLDGTGRDGNKEQEQFSSHTQVPTRAEPVMVGVFEGHADVPRGTQGITPQGAASIAMRAAGVRVTSQNPDLLAAIAEGVTAEHLAEVARLYPGKPAGYVIAAARREHADRAAPIATGPPRNGHTEAPSKTMQAIQTLMRGTTDGRMAEQRDPGRAEPLALPAARKRAGG